MWCSGCGNPSAYIVKTWWEGVMPREVCNLRECGDLRTPYVPDVYFRQPEFVENLADQDHPFGRYVESPRHKARIMQEQGVREDGDFVRGSRDKGVKMRERKPSPELLKKAESAVKMALLKLKKDHGAPVTVPLKMVRRK